MIGFLGAGRLGEPMVRRLLGAGHPVSVFARRDEVRARLRTTVRRWRIPFELAESADILVTGLFSDAQLRETGLGPDGFIARAKSSAIFDDPATSPHRRYVANRRHGDIRGCSNHPCGAGR
jgi:3-hydroxyisobutyrate dehydrogenase-like beta-hydroxyacid dehydrogenase